MEEDRAGLLIVTYHYIRDPAAYLYPGIHPFGEKEFVGQVRRLKERFHVASPGEVEAFAGGAGTLKGPAVFFTFDDGLTDHARVVNEVLDPLEIRAAFCISSRPFTEGRALMVHKIHWLRAHTPPDLFRQEFLQSLPPEGKTLADEEDSSRAALETYIYDSPEHARLKYLINFRLPHGIVDEVASGMLEDRGMSEADFCEQVYMDVSQIRKLSGSGHVIGNHGHSHQPFSVLSPSLLEKEVVESKAFFERVTGLPQQWVSYPYGRAWALPKDVKAFCRSYGFSVGLGLNGGWNSDDISPFCLNRVNANDVEAVV